MRQVAGDTSCCPGYRDPQLFCPLRDVLDMGAAVAQRCLTSPDERSPLSDAASTPNGVSPCGSTLDLPAPSQDPNHKVRVSRRASSTLSVASGGGREKTARGPGKSRKGSLKIRLSKLFRTKSCNGSNEPPDKSVDLAVSVGSLDVMDVSGSNGREKDLGSFRSQAITHHTRMEHYRGDKRFECSQCQKRFMRSDHLTKHYKTHMNTKNL
ncbi:UNVERIFIED_CONTAM: hypothetical protein FKN15_042332 [Acipenser sinensis]